MVPPLNQSIVISNTVNNTLSYVKVPHSADLNLTGDFTIEWWQYQTGSQAWPRLFDSVNLNGSGNSTGHIFGLSNEGGSLYLWLPGAILIATINAQDYKNKWVHFAIVRSSGIISLYKDGTQIGNTISNSSSIIYNGATTYDLYVGVGLQSFPTSSLLGASYSGYIYNFQWLPGTAKYNGAFTPSTTKPDTTTYAIFLSGALAEGTLANTVEYSNTSVTNQIPTAPVISTICFRTGTQVTTDQGLVSIENILKDIHTIDGNQIRAITQSITPEPFIMMLKKDLFGLNSPTQDTFVTANHLIIYQGSLRSAVSIPGAQRVPYNQEIMYNVVMDDHRLMLVNGITAETLHPKNPLAKIYMLDANQRSQIINEINKKHISILQSNPATAMIANALICV